MVVIARKYSVKYFWKIHVHVVLIFHEHILFLTWGKKALNSDIRTSMRSMRGHSLTPQKNFRRQEGLPLNLLAQTLQWVVWVPPSHWDPDRSLQQMHFAGGGTSPSWAHCQRGFEKTQVLGMVVPSWQVTWHHMRQRLEASLEYSSAAEFHSRQERP